MKILKEEFIGETLEIIESKNKSLEGFKGLIVDETKSTFKIKIKDEIKIILKNISTFKINDVEIQGNKIMKRPIDRIKMKV